MYGVLKSTRRRASDVHAFALVAASLARGGAGRLVVLGNQKSGTTAVAALLARALGEACTLDFFYRLDRPFRRCIMNGEMTFAQFALTHARYFRPAVTKEPDLTFLYTQVRQAFPKAQYVLVVRDPRHNIRSILNRLRIAGDAPLEADTASLLADSPGMNANSSREWSAVLDEDLPGSHAANWLGRLANRWNACYALHVERRPELHLLRYEDFCVDKESSIADLVVRLGRRQVQALGAAADRQFQPIGDHRTSLHEFFGPLRLAMIEQWCSEGMAHFGYRGVSRVASSGGRHVP